MSYTVAALYQFLNRDDYTLIQPLLEQKCQALELKGTLLLAQEGINGTVAGSRTSIDALKTYLEELGFDNMEYKESVAEEIPFLRMKVKLRKEIVNFGVDNLDPVNGGGKRLSPEQWNAVIQDPDVVVIDTRNTYEYDIGTFKNAISPDTENFREFPRFVESQLDPDKNKKIAMFCTGGIRCEKASAYMLGQGFEEVYQLNGGILRYLEEVKPEENLWQGDCFVFDGRVSVDSNIEQGNYQQCFACRRPLSEEELQSPDYQQGVSCPKCIDTLTAEKKSRFEERQKQVQLAEDRGVQHIGQKI